MAEGNSVRSSEEPERTVDTARFVSLSSLRGPGNTPSASSGGTSSLERRACRICQSESGVLLRPCGCSGTMGDIHEECLSRWICESGRDKECEICKEPYSKGDFEFKPFHEWERPKISLRDLMTVVTLVAMALSIGYIVWLIIDRRCSKYYDSQCNLPLRPDDYARYILAVAFSEMEFVLAFNFGRTAVRYLKRQRIVHFTDRN